MNKKVSFVEYVFVSSSDQLKKVPSHLPCLAQKYFAPPILSVLAYFVRRAFTLSLAVVSGLI